MKGWMQSALSDLAQFPPKVKLVKHALYPFIGMDRVEPGERFATSAEVRNWSGSGSKFANGDVLFSRITPCLDNRKVAQARIDGQGFGSTEFFVLRARDGKCDQNWLYYLSTTDLLIQNGINSYVGASGRQRADDKFLKQVTIRHPKPKEQRKIAAVLTAYDDLIENNRQRIALLEKMAEEIYREWFVRLRFPGHEHTPVHKGVPEGWQQCTLDEVTILIKRGISPKYGDSPNVVLNQKCIRDGQINFEHSRTHVSRVSNEKKLQPFDVLINSTGVGTLGRTAIVGPFIKDVTADSHITICRANAKKADKIFLGFMIRMMEHIFENMAAGATGQTELNAGLVKAIKVLVPDLALQEKFAREAVPMMELHHLLMQENISLRKTRNLLLNRLISGKLRVDDLDVAFPPSMAAEAEPSATGTQDLPECV